MQRLLFALIGLTLGSFGNVLVYRIAAGQSIGGRSRCPSCRRTLRAIDLVPIVSYVLLGGRCRRCHARISLRYPLVEAGSMLLFLLVAWWWPDAPLFAYLSGVCLYFLFLIALEDAESQEISDALTLLLGCAVIALVFAKSATQGDLAAAFIDALTGAAIALVWFGGQWLVSRGRMMGAGDIFLGIVIGFWLGWFDTIVMLALSYIVGACVILVMLGVGVRSFDERRIAFAPFLAIGTLLAILGAGQWYLALFL